MTNYPHDVVCKHCNGSKIHKKGRPNGRQRYYCITCDRAFVEKSDKKKIKSTQNIIVTRKD